MEKAVHTHTNSSTTKSVAKVSTGGKSMPAMPALQAQSKEHGELPLQTTPAPLNRETTRFTAPPPALPNPGDNPAMSRFVTQRKQADEPWLPKPTRFNPLQKKENSIAAPNNLESGIETLHRFDMRGFAADRNFGKTAQREAYDTGMRIPQLRERHPQHDAWHVVQKRRSGIKDTVQMKVGVNDGAELGQEAGETSEKATEPTSTKPISGSSTFASNVRGNGVIQRVKWSWNGQKWDTKEPFVQKDIPKRDGKYFGEQFDSDTGEYSGEDYNGFSVLSDLDGIDDSDDSDDYMSDTDENEAKPASAAKATKRKERPKKPQKGSFIHPQSCTAIERRLAGGRYRTTKVSAIVKPTSTKGRKGAPESDTGLKTGVQWKMVGSTTSRNTGIVDAQKGHIMALELGGPDIPENIVPQWAQFQSNGAWRQAERKVLAMALDVQKKNQKILYECEVFYKEYKDPSQATMKGLFFPTVFKLQVTLCDAKENPIAPPQVIFDSPQAQNETDDMMAERQFDKAEAQSASDSSEDSSSEDSGSEEDEQKHKKKKTKLGSL